MKRWAWLAGLAGGLTLAGAALAETQSLTILHDNDIHGHLRSFCYVEVAKGPDEHCDIGGAARRATLVKRLRADGHGAGAAGRHRRHLDARAAGQRQYEGVDEIAAMNAIGYDLAAIGNNEFKLKDAEDIHDAAGAQAALAKLIAASHFPWICANATEADGSPLPGVKPFIVQAHRQAAGSVPGPHHRPLGDLPADQGPEVHRPGRGGQGLDPEGARRGRRGDRGHPRSASPTTSGWRTRPRGLDAIDRRRLATPTSTSRWCWKNARGADVPIVQDGEFGVRLGMFDLTFEGDAAHGWKLTHYADELLPVTRRAEARPAAGGAGRALRPRRSTCAVGQLGAHRRDAEGAPGVHRRGPRPRLEGRGRDRRRPAARGRPLRGVPHPRRHPLPGARHRAVPRHRLEGPDQRRAAGRRCWPSPARSAA